MTVELYSNEQLLLPQIDILGLIHAKMRQNRSFLVFWPIYDVTYLKNHTYDFPYLYIISRDVSSATGTES